MIKEDLDTPAAIVDLDKMERNIAEMVEVMRQAGVKLRPHTKTHKIPAIAHRQLSAGAVGITVAKTGEAEVMAAAGIEDIFIAYPVIGAPKWERLSMLNRQIRLRVSVDSVVGAQGLSEYFARRGERIEVLMKIDTGLGRTGVLPGEPALRLAQALSGMKGIRLVGIFTHEGHLSKVAFDQRKERVEEVGAMMRETAERLRGEGFDIEEVSLGATPTARIACGLEGVTEERPGNYIFYDGNNVAIGVIPPARCALTVLCTVVSTPAPDRAVLDGGTKAFSSARHPELEGMGIVVGMEDAIFRWANEEHGVLDLSRCPGALRIGDRVEVIPVHVCETVNLWDELVGVRDGEVEVVWPVAGRGKVR